MRIDIPEYNTFVDFPNDINPIEIERVLRSNFPAIKDIANPDGSWKVDISTLPVKPTIPEDSWMETIGKGAMQGLTRLPKAIGGLMSMPGRALGIGGGVWEAVEKGAEDAEKYWKPDVPEQGLKDYVGQAIGQMAGMGVDIALPMGAVSRTARTVTEAVPGVQAGMQAVKNVIRSPLGIMGAESGATKAAEMQKEDAPFYTVLAGGLTQAGLEITTEKLPLDAIMKPGVAFLKRLAKGLITDIPGELTATAGEMYLSNYSGYQTGTVIANQFR